MIRLLLAICVAIVAVMFTAAGTAQARGPFAFQRGFNQGFRQALNAPLVTRNHFTVAPFTAGQVVVTNAFSAPPLIRRPVVVQQFVAPSNFLQLPVIAPVQSFYSPVQAFSTGGCGALLLGR